jgi:hypothetical protein
MRNTADVTGVSAINPLVAFYNFHGGKREVLFFYFVPDTTRDTYLTLRLQTVTSDRQEETKIAFINICMSDSNIQIYVCVHTKILFIGT